jgi:hypothetical protein
VTDANAVAATLQQVAVGLGVAVGAILLRVGDAAFGGPTGSAPYAAALVVLALFMLVPLVDAVRLPADSGDEVAGRAG